MTQTFIVAGSSIAGLSAARELRRGGFDGRLITIDSDPHAPYRRPEVSKGLLKVDLADSRAKLQWSEELGAERLTARLTGLDAGEHLVRGVGDEGELALSYDALVIATGVRSRPSPFPPLGGVHSLRFATDSAALRRELDGVMSVVIVGGGFIGLEVATVLGGMGREVTVIEPMAMPLAHILGPEFSAELQRKHMAEGVRFRLGTTVQQLVADPTGERVSGVRTSEGDVLPAELVLVAVGSVPAIDWLEGSGLVLEGGIVCDATCAAIGAEDVVAAGDIAVWENPLYGRRMRVEHWSHAIEQGTYAAKRLLGTHDPAGFVSVPYFWTEQVGLRIQSIGSTFGYDRVEVLDPDPERMFVAYLKGDRVISVAGFAAGASIFMFRGLIAAGATIDEVRAQFEHLQQAA